MSSNQFLAHHDEALPLASGCLRCVPCWRFRGHQEIASRYQKHWGNPWAAIQGFPCRSTHGMDLRRWPRPRNSKLPVWWCERHSALGNRAGLRLEWLLDLELFLDCKTPQEGRSKPTGYAISTKNISSKTDAPPIGGPSIVEISLDYTQIAKQRAGVD